MWRELPFAHTAERGAAGIPADPSPRRPAARRARVSSRARRRLILGLRRAARRAAVPEPAGAWRTLMLPDRLVPVREELLAIAALLEQAGDPDPATCDVLRRLLTDGCESPLYNRRVHRSELWATLYYARRRLASDAGSEAT